MSRTIGRTLNNRIFKKKKCWTPSVIKIARDINLINKKKLDVISIVKTEKLTLSNYRDLISFESNMFIDAVYMYRCDICHTDCSPKNTIYTNNYYQGVDICSRCIKTSFKTIERIPDFHPGPVYSLKDIYYTINDTEN